MSRLFPVLLVCAALFGASCGTERTESTEASGRTEDTDRSETGQTVRSGDGVLDCLDGSVPSSSPIAVAGATEEQVVATALAKYVDGGATLVALPPDDSWMAVEGGRDVAMVYPTLQADGRWQVDALISCGLAAPPQPEPNGSLDCAGDETWGVVGEIAPDADGHQNVELALEETLQPFADRFGGEIRMIAESESESESDERSGDGAGRASLVVGGSERVVASAIEFRPDRWAVSGFQGCGGYRLD